MVDDKERRERKLQRARARRRRVLCVRAALGVGILVIAALAWVIGNSIAEKNKHKKAEQELEEAYAAGEETINGFCQEYIQKNGLEDVGQQESFSDWLLNKWGKNYQIAMVEKLSAGLQKRDFYELTGNSLTVLADEYLGRLNEENHIYQREGSGQGQAVLTFAGDLCLAEEGFVLDHYQEEKGLSSAISQEILDETNGADVFFLNHEYCVSERGEPLQGKMYTFRADPGRMKILEEMGTDIVSLANNHVYDYGAEAMLDTVDYLDEAQIPYVGGGRNYQEAAEPVYFVVNGMKIGYVAATRAEKTRYTPEATEDSPGVLLTYDTEAYNQVIEEAARQCDYLVAYVHWGTEDSDQYEEYQHEMAEEFFASGADIIVGGHPHVLQGIEYLEEKPVVYSMGDFWFNDEDKYTGLLEVQISIDGLQEMRFVPCRQVNYTTQYLSNAQEQRELYDYLEELSLNVSIDDNGVIKEEAEVSSE